MDFSHLSLQIGNGLFASQVFDLLGGLFLLLIGAAIVYTLAVWRLRGLQVDGELIGIRRRGLQFHAVYRYASPGGGSREATSVQGRNDPRGLETGRHVPIQVMPDKPDEARERHAPVLWSLALGSLLGGAWLVYIGATVSPHGPIVWALIVFAVAFVGHWLWRRVRALLAKIGPVAVPHPWSAVPIESSEFLGASPTSTLRMTSNRSASRRSGAIFVVVGLGLFALCFWQARGLLDMRHGVRTSGTVLELSEGTAGRSGDTFLFPVVQYTGQDGSVVRFNDRTGARPSPFKVGDTVPVLYLPGAPTSATIDHGLGNWEPLAGLAIMGIVSTGLGLVTLRRS